MKSDAAVRGMFGGENGPRGTSREGQGAGEGSVRRGATAEMKFEIFFLNFLNVQEFCGKSNRMQDRYFD